MTSSVASKLRMPSLAAEASRVLVIEGRVRTGIRQFEKHVIYVIQIHSWIFSECPGGFIEPLGTRFFVLVRVTAAHSASHALDVARSVL